MLRKHAGAAVGAAMGMALAPASLWAHPGHGQGDHGWLVGALQPLLGLDHFLAGVFVLGAGAVGMVVLGRARAAKGEAAGER